MALAFPSGTVGRSELDLSGDPGHLNHSISLRTNLDEFPAPPGLDVQLPRIKADCSLTAFSHPDRDCFQRQFSRRFQRRSEKGSGIGQAPPAIDPILVILRSPMTILSAFIQTDVCR